MRRKTALILAFCLACGLVVQAFAVSTDRLIQANQREQELRQGIQDPDAGSVVYTCASGAAVPNDQGLAAEDHQFLQDLRTALEARWQLGEYIPADISREQSMTVRGKLVQAELNSLAGYAEKTLQDPWLDLLAHAYMQGVQNQKTAVEQYRDQDLKFFEYWTKYGTYYRCAALYLINAYYHVYISEACRQEMEETLLTGSMLQKEDPVVYMADAAGGSGLPADTFGIVDLTAYYDPDNVLTTDVTIRNDTGEVAADINLVLCFLDSNGTLIHTETVSNTSRIRAGQAVKVSARIKDGNAPASVYVDQISYTDAGAQKKNVFMDHIETFQLPGPNPDPTPAPVAEDIAEYHQGMEAYAAGDLQEAFTLLRSSAERGNADAQCQLANMYYLGDAEEGVPQQEKAAYWYGLAAAQGQTEAQMRIGRMYFLGEGGLVQSYAQAANYIIPAAEKGEANAQNLLGVMYANGLFLEQSDQKAAEYYTLAAGQGLGKAQANLGILYYFGQYFDQSYEKAAEWFLKAVEQNVPEAQYYLGTMYENGLGVEKSTEKAKAYYQLAADQGNAQARERLDSIK